MRRAARGPSLFGGADEPDGIGSEAGGLGGAGNQDRRILRFRREDSFAGRAFEDGKKLLPCDGAAIEPERRAFVDGLLPAAMSLKFGAGKRTSAGPACKFQELWHELCPHEG